MSQVDQFESAFRSAIRPVYEPHDTELHQILTITDLSSEAAERFEKSIQHYLNRLNTTASQPRFSRLDEGSYDSTASLLTQVAALKPNLIVTYRNLNTEDWRYQNSMGSRLDTLIHQTEIPILVLPHPKAQDSEAFSLPKNERVIVVTDHLTGDHTLIDYAATFVEPDGRLILVHLEDQTTFDRYMDAISKITTIDTEQAQSQIYSQLLKEPHVYISSCRDRLKDSIPSLQVDEIVEFGEGFDQFRDHIRRENANLLVIKGVNHQQPGIHGLADRLINETRYIPVLVV